MTRNEHILLIMSWARSYHGLALDDCVMLAERVLDEDFGGSIADANPAEVMRCVDKQYFKAHYEGEIFVDERGNVPTWEEHGYVRVPVRPQPGNVILSDETVVNVALLDSEPLELVSGGTIPVLSPEDQDAILPIIFCDPVGITQEDIDQMVENPPDKLVPKTHIESVAVKVYDQIKRDYVEMLKSGWQEHGHTH